METKDWNDDDLKNDAPFLFMKEKKNPFQKDDAYFEKLTSSIQQKINAEESSTILQRIFKYILTPQISIPVTITIIVAAIFLVRYYHHDTEIATVTNAQIITVDELIKSDYLYQIDAHLIAESMESVKNETNASDIENYLIDNNININELSEELINTTKLN